jgi:hypothetical protein
MEKNKHIKSAYFGPSNAPYFSLFLSCKGLIPDTNFYDINLISEIDMISEINRETKIFIVATDFRYLSQEFAKFHGNGKAVRKFMSSTRRSLILCDSIKKFWCDFSLHYKDFFTHFYTIDLPIEDLEFANGLTNAKPIYGIPLPYHFYENDLNVEDMNLITFAGRIDIYPERKKFIDDLIACGVPVKPINNIELGYPKQHQATTHKNCMEFLFKSIFSLNFPGIPQTQGNYFHVKGRYWESLATGCFLIEPNNSVISRLPFEFNILNYKNINEIKSFIFDIGLQKKMYR